MFHDNTELLPRDDSSDLSPGNFYPAEGVRIFLVIIYISNKLVWVEVANKDWT